MKKTTTDGSLTLLKELTTANKPYQSWVLINMDDAGQDAVYIYTPNPNSDNYPYKNHNIDWNCSIPNSFKELFDIKSYNMGFLSDEYGERYYIQSKTSINNVKGLTQKIESALS